MSASTAGRVIRTAVLGAGGLLVFLLTAAPPAAAHTVSGGTLPLPPWLLGYLGAFVVAATAVVLRATWTAPRLRGLVAGGEPDDGAAAPLPAATERRRLDLRPGHVAGTVLFALTVAVAVTGPDSYAGNLAPVAVLVVWWVGLPIVCLVAGDVMRTINPFVAVVALLDRRRTGGEDLAGAPRWTAAAFLGVFTWYLVAYHRPGSPRALAMLLVTYAAAAVVGGLRWGQRWLATGEAFGAISAAAALLCPWRRGTAPPPGLTAVMVVWLGGTAFDAFGSTPFWIDVLGTSEGWTRTALNTVGLVWITAVVAGVYLTALRLAERSGDPADPPASLIEPLGVALVPLALGWFLAHDITLLLADGQNAILLVSDPVGRGWDLFGTVDRRLDFGIVQSVGVAWLQVGLLAVGHVLAVVVTHDVALCLVGRRAALRATWAIAGAGVVSIAAAALMVLG